VRELQPITIELSKVVQLEFPNTIELETVEQAAFPITTVDAPVVCDELPITIELHAPVPPTEEAPKTIVPVAPGKIWFVLPKETEHWTPVEITLLAPRVILHADCTQLLLPNNTEHPVFAVIVLPVPITCVFCDVVTLTVLGPKTWEFVEHKSEPRLIDPSGAQLLTPIAIAVP
jgi:hypothetical protein